jgi:aspartate carbamoyltransferase catalytic subunit
VNAEALRAARENVLIMHPGPVNRGVELASELYSPENSVIDEQVTNGVAVRMAVLYLFTKRMNENDDFA